MEEWLRAAYENPSDETLEGTKSDVFFGRALLWLAVEGKKPIAAAVSKVWITQKSKVCSVLAVGGNAKGWPNLLNPIENYAAAEGCASVRLEGRRGWARVFKDYTQPWIVLEKKVN